MTYLELLHRLQLAFISGNAPCYHLCDSFRVLTNSVFSSENHMAKRFERALAVKIEQLSQKAFDPLNTLESHYAVDAGYVVPLKREEVMDGEYTMDVSYSYNWYSDANMYHLRLQILNELIAEQSSS